MMLVWDVTYTASGDNITSLTKTLSNGSTAGIASMPGARIFGVLANVFQDSATGPLSRVDPAGFISTFEVGMAKSFSYPLASQLSGRPVLLAQVRTSKVVTKIPAAAVWLLVVANLGYAALGAVLAVWAITKTTPAIHQVQIRLGVAGLASALFDREQFERKAATDEGLFEEKARVGVGLGKRVGVKQTETGGSSFEVYPLRNMTEENKGMQRAYFEDMVG
jgi:hypothetical protein